MSNLSFDSSDFLLIRWSIISFVVSSLIAAGIFLGVDTLESESNSERQRANTQFQRAQSSVELIEEEEATILENIDEYTQLVSQGIMEPEDRLQFLEDIAVIRDDLHLFPINLSITEQFNERLQYPEGGSSGGPIDLASSEISLSMPLLHEDDFIRFLDAVNTNGGLFQIRECDLGLRNTGAKSFLTLQQHMTLSCVLIWHTYDLNPIIEQEGLLGSGNGFL